MKNGCCTSKIYELYTKEKVLINKNDTIEQ